MTSCPLDPWRSTELGGTVPIPSVVPSLSNSASLVTAVYMREILYQVAFHTMPSGVRLKMLWNLVTADLVLAPKTPAGSVMAGIAG